MIDLNILSFPPPPPRHLLNQFSLSCSLSIVKNNSQDRNDILFRCKIIFYTLTPRLVFCSNQVENLRQGYFDEFELISPLRR